MKVSSFLKSLGPGLLYAGAAVGVSHLVQSTRAGAAYGYELIGVLILANIIKYPFFEFAPRFASSTGKSLISGYNQLGKWALILYFLLTISTMFAITAAVLLVTVGLFANLSGLELPTQYMILILSIIIIAILVIGKFKLLEVSMKYIILILSVSTLFAVLLAFKPSLSHTIHFDWSNSIDIAFLIAFVGWMPAPFDVSVWHSTWTVAKQSASKEKISMNSALRDFRIGYIGTAILAIGFVMLGALIMYGSGQEFSSGGVAFSGQLIQMYTQSLGSWAYFIIAIAAFTTMLSTTITVFDAYPRVLNPTFGFLVKKENQNFETNNRGYYIWMLVLLVGTFILLFLMSKSMKFMVDLATTISFVTAPVLAALNLAVVMNLPKADQPGRILRLFSWISLILLTCFSIYYLIWKFL